MPLDVSKGRMEWIVWQSRCGRVGGSTMQRRFGLSERGVRLEEHEAPELWGSFVYDVLSTGALHRLA